MASKKLRSQVISNLYELVKALILLGICLYSGIQVYFHGSGNRTEPGKGLKGQMVKLLHWLKDQGHEKLVTGILLAIFGITALICLFLLFYHMEYLTPKRSVLGRSILAQATKYEKFSDLVQAINADLTVDTKEFGTELLVGAKWLLSEQAIRISTLEQLYTGEKQKKYVMLAADGEGNIIEVSFAREEHREEAVRYLQGRVPELYMGNLQEIE